MVLPKENPSKSFWIEAAESPLRNLRSTPELPKQTDIVIIGSGYTGATTAYWIHKHTASHGTTPEMVMLEARDICGGATGRNGGQLRPHAYSRYGAWSARFGPAGALALIEHEMAHLPAFRQLFAAEEAEKAAAEGAAEQEEEQEAYPLTADEVCLQFGDTFDAGMTAPAWAHLRAQYDAFVRDHGPDGPVIRDIRLLDDPREAEAFTQIKGALGAVVHPAGQVWPYKFVHGLLRRVLATGHLNLQAHTPAVAVSSARDAEGFLTVQTPRGAIRAKAVVHATNAWASHVLPEYTNLIFQSVSTVGALKTGRPAGFLRATGAQHWGGDIWNYHLQLPAPHHHIVLGGAKSVLTHYPRTWHKRNDDDLHLPGVPEYMTTWPTAEVAGFDELEEQEGKKGAVELALPADQGGVWTGVVSPSVDGFPFVGPVPGADRAGHFIAAGFGGHGMPRILLSTAHLTPLVLDAVGVQWSAPALVKDYPPIPAPFVVTAERVAALQHVDATAEYEADIKAMEEDATKEYCNGPRSLHWKGRI